MNEKIKICVLGLGYVGLPIALEFSKKYWTIGYDLNSKRIIQLKKNTDVNYDINSKKLKKNKNLFFSSNFKDATDCNYYIVCVPTPVNKNNKPNLFGIKEVSKKISKVLNKNDFVIYESTVYPGATEEICIPILEKGSGLKINKNFFCGFSPERLNPGDNLHRLTTIKKIVSGSNTYALKKIDFLYKSIIKAGTHKTESIKIAEAAKIIENTQRDLNIALMNEFAVFLNKMNVSTAKVLKAANTKWNFLNFKPGLVGGHCIGVDPYYLTYKAKKIGLDPKVILAGRKTNDQLFKFIFKKIKEICKFKKINRKKLNILFLGCTFKENVSDIRNSQTINLIELMGVNKKNIIHVYEPNINNLVLRSKIKLIKKLNFDFKYDIIVHTVKHKDFKLLYKIKIYKKLLRKSGFIFDLHGVFQNNENTFFL